MARPLCLVEARSRREVLVRLIALARMSLRQVRRIPAPQLPASFAKAAPAGSSTFLSTFNGVVPHGAWKLFLYDNGGSGNGANLSAGWCIDLILPTTGKISANAGGGYRVDFTGNPNQQYTVQYADSLPALPATPAWQMLSMPTAASNGTFFVTDTPPAGTTTRSYRAIVP